MRLAGCVALVSTLGVMTISTIAMLGAFHYTGDRFGHGTHPVLDDEGNEL